MHEKVTAYDLSYLNNNPFENITAQILLGNIDKVNRCSINETVDAISHERRSIISNISSFISSFFYCEASDLLALEKERLYKLQENAITYDDWLAVSQQLDILENNDAWKDINESNLYDYQAVKDQLEELRFCRKNKDYEKLLYIIRTKWKRDFAGINNEVLYRKSHVGTKKLISEYIDECVTCLGFLVAADCPLDDEYILGVLLESKRNYGRAAITMSGGGTFGLIGIGVFSTLLEMDLFPKIVSGSSCGSIVSSIMCSKTSDEIKHILSGLFDKTFEVFNLESDNDTIYTHLSKLLKYGVWFDSRYLQQTMQEFLGNMTFREAYNKTGRILNITVSSATVHDQPTLLNYLTAPNVLIWSAVCASCSLPVVFASSTIYEKNLETGEFNEWSNPMLKFVDGSLNSDLPISRLSEMFNVNHTIACQVNPHIAPLVKLSSDCNDINTSVGAWNFKRLFYNFTDIFSLELTHYCDILSELGIVSNLASKIKQLILQSYTGNITLLPELKFGEQLKTLTNPTPEFIWDSILKGARTTWPKISLIRDQYTVEFSMDKYISVLKSRVVFETKSSTIPLNRTSVSSYATPKKQSQVVPPTSSGNPYISPTEEQRKRSETITLSEKLRREESISPFSSRVNMSNKKNNVKCSYRKKVSKYNKEMPGPLKPDHSFESLRNIQRKYSDTANVEQKRKKHTRSFSYTQIPDMRYTFVKDVVLNVDHEDGVEDPSQFIINNDKITAPAATDYTPEEVSISCNNDEDDIMMYEGSNIFHKNKRE